MKCLMKYEWVKLPRNILPTGKGIMGTWAKLASRAAFRKGEASYCGHRNAVNPGMWSGGIVGLKSIVGLKNRSQTLERMDALSQLGFITYELNTKTKKLSYYINDWVVKCSGEECMHGSVYATDGYGFLCIPRSITQRLVEKGYKFEEADAWLDLWCHSVSEDPNNAFSYLAPTVQYGTYGALLTLETLGQRWGWEKTKVWRFFKKYGNVFSLYRLPGSYGCLIFNGMYPTETGVSLPMQEDIVRIIEEIRIIGINTHKTGSDHENMSKLVVLYSQRLMKTSKGKSNEQDPENRVADLDSIIYTYISQCRNCKNCEYDCQSKSNINLPVIELNKIRGPCCSVNITKIAKEFFTYEQAG